MDSPVLLRRHPSLAEFVENLQTRHADDEELDVYLSVAPGNEARARAAAEIRDVEGPIVRKVVKRIFEVYPYEAQHDLAVTKATRDIRLVVFSASLAMLLGDPEWLKLKVLYWLKRILQAFRFPDKLPNQEYVMRDPASKAALAKMQPYQRSIYDTFAMLREEMERALSPEAYKEIEPYLTLTVDILSHD